MSHRIVAILRELRQDLARHLDRHAILDACRATGHTWRDCRLDPPAIVHLFLLQVLHGNTALTHLPRLAGWSFTASAFCQARARLPLAVFREVLRRVGVALRRDTDADGRWLGHRTILVDGSSFSMPDTPELQAHFGQSKKAKPGCGFPVAHLMALFDAGTGLLREAFAAPLHSGDLGLVRRLHPHLDPGDVLVGDRGFCSFAHLALLVDRGLHAVFRIHGAQIVDFTPGRPHAERRGRDAAARGLPRSRWLHALGLTDQVVAWLKLKKPPLWMDAQEFGGLPEMVTLRELRYRVEVPGFRTRAVTLVTTLTDGTTYSAEALAELYFRRWQIETHLRELKRTMGLDVLKCATVAGVTKELVVHALAYNLVRVVMLEAARRQGVAVERISFIDALRWLAAARPGETLPSLVVNPRRPHRFEPRSTKRRPKQYPWMSAPRSELRKRLLDKAHVA
jgi:hypothetical protein